MKMQKNERGITLVALVVTIVVLLILAGVTIMYVMSDNGIFGQAERAGSETNINAVREAVEMAISGIYPEVYTSETTTFTDAFTKNLSATMQGTGFTAGTCQVSTPRDVSTLTLEGCTIKYKDISYTVTYNKTEGVKVVGGDYISSTVSGTSKAST